MAEPADMIVPLLQEMRAENAARHKQSLERLAAIEERLDNIVATQLSFRQALTADARLSKLVTGKLGERINVLRHRAVREPESRT